MSAESEQASSTAPARLREQQLELTRHLRDPEHVPPPAGIEDRRLAIYRELLFNNIESLLSGNFPVIRKLLGETGWKALVRDFYRNHRSQTREFLRYLESLPQLEPPFLGELAHYEWVELALQISEARLDGIEHDPEGDLLGGSPVVSPLAWPLAYRWPVHHLGPDYQPATPPDEPTLLLLRREADGSVRFSTLSGLAFRLLARYEEAPQLSGLEQLQALAGEAGVAPDENFLAQGASLLAQMRANGTLLGTALRA